MTECNQSAFEFEAHFSRQVVARFDGGTITTDGGGLLLRQTDRRLNLLPRLAECFLDGRSPLLVRHSVEQLVSQRVYGLALGYEDLNDHEQLRQDPLLRVLAGKADVVFGSRFRGGNDAHRVLYFWHSVGNNFLTMCSNMATNLNLTDMETCYKIFRRELIQKIMIEENRFGFEPEITAKVARLNVRIFEVAVSYNGRTYAEGKKIGWRDGFRALWCIGKYNFWSR